MMPLAFGLGSEGSIPAFTPPVSGKPPVGAGMIIVLKNWNSAVVVGNAPWEKSKSSPNPSCGPSTSTAAGDVLGPQLGFGLDFDFSQGAFPTTTALFQFFKTMIIPAPTGGFPDTGGVNAGIEPSDPNPNAKGIMVTQSLQGLANFDVKADGLLRHRFSNAPYHWRGDKKTFLDFNEAFVGLQGRSEEIDPL